MPLAANGANARTDQSAAGTMRGEQSYNALSEQSGTWIFLQSVIQWRPSSATPDMSLAVQPQCLYILDDDDVVFRGDVALGLDSLECCADALT